MAKKAKRKVSTTAARPPALKPKARVAKSSVSKSQAKKSQVTKSKTAKSKVVKLAKARASRRAAEGSRTTSKAKVAQRSRGPVTALDYARLAAASLNKACVTFSHGTTDAFAEAAFLVSETLQFHPYEFDAFARTKVSAAQASAIRDLVERRITTRKPAAYLLNKMYMLGVPFYVDERTIVPRSFIGEILAEHFNGDDSLVGDPVRVSRVLDLCTGSGCLAILAAYAFPNAMIDAVDLSKDAIEVAKVNVEGHDLVDRVNLYSGDLFAPLGGKTYDLIISNPPYVDAQGMASLPPECLEEPAMAFDGGVDGIDIVRRILNQAGLHLNPDGGLLCEIGRCAPAVEQAYPTKPFFWIDTEDSEGEVFWLDAAQLRTP